MHYVERTVPPAQEPVSLPEARSFLKVDTTEDDSLIASLIVGAVEWVELVTSRALITSTYEWTTDAIEASMDFPRRNVQAVSSVTYLDSATGSPIVASEVTYPRRVVGGRLLWSAGYPWSAVPGGVVVTFTAGYGDDPQDVPEPLREAIRLLVGHHYETRTPVDTGANSAGALGEVGYTIQTLLRPYRPTRF